MRVVHVITGLGQGGAEAMLEKLLHAGRRLNPEIDQQVISLRGLGVVGARLLESGFQVRALDMTTSIVSLFKLARLASMLRAFPRDTVVQTWMWHGDLLGGVCARMVGRGKVIWNVRNALPIDIARRRTSIWAVRLCAKLSRWVPQRIVCNAEAAKSAHCAIGYDVSRCVVVRNGFDLDRFKPMADRRNAWRDRMGVRDEEVLVGMIARMDPLKDHTNFVRAAALVVASGRHEHLRFVLVGKGVPASTHLRTSLEQSGLEGRFLLLDRQEDVPGVMNALDVFCLSSRSEGFPNVLGEAMACGVPCVTTDVGDARLVLGDDRWVAPPGSARDLADRLSALLDLPDDERQELGSVQRLRIERDFGIDAAWRQYLQLYQALR